MKFRALLSFALLAMTVPFLSSCSNSANGLNASIGTPTVVPQYVYVVCDQCTGTGTPSEVLTYAVNSSSAVPVTTLTSPTGQHWQSVSTDASGNLYVVSASANYSYSILVYAAGSTGTATPTRTITSSSITNGDFDGIIVAPNGTIYYSDDDYGLEVYPATASGVSTPTAINSHFYPRNGGVDSAGNIFFPYSSGGIVMLPSNFTSTSSPVLITAIGFTTNYADAVSLDSAGNIYMYVSTSNNVSQVLELPHTTTAGAVTPTKALTLPTRANTAYAAPAVDSSGNIYAYTNWVPIAITEIAASATSGTPTPINTITTTLTVNSFNTALVVH